MIMVLRIYTGTNCVNHKNQRYQRSYFMNRYYCCPIKIKTIVCTLEIMWFM